MSKDNKDISFFDELPEPTEPAGFSHQQMVRCEDCLRANPPTRVTCLYCGYALPQTEASVALAKPSLRPLETWEQGYNSILVRLRDGAPSEELVMQVAALLRLEPHATQLLLLARCPMPLARASTPEEAALVARRLHDLGLETVTVADQDLQIDTAPPRRLRKLELNEAELVTYQIGSTDGVPIAWAEIELVMLGRLFVKQMELREKKRRKAEKELLDSREFSSDEAVVDIYAEKREGSWRISASGFDFSCLGLGKALLAGENFPKLMNLFRERATNAEFFDSYPVRHSLELVWPPEKRIESSGWSFRGSKHGRTEIITASSEPQFTRYSRLYQYLKRNSLVQPDGY